MENAREWKRQRSNQNNHPPISYFAEQITVSTCPSHSNTPSEKTPILILHALLHRWNLYALFVLFICSVSRAKLQWRILSVVTVLPGRWWIRGFFIFRNWVSSSSVRSGSFRLLNLSSFYFIFSVFFVLVLWETNRVYLTWVFLLSCCSCCLQLEFASSANIASMQSHFLQVRLHLQLFPFPNLLVRLLCISRFLIWRCILN